MPTATSPNLWFWISLVRRRWLLTFCLVGRCLRRLSTTSPLRLVTERKRHLGNLVHGGSKWRDSKKKIVLSLFSLISLFRRQHEQIPHCNYGATVSRSNNQTTAGKRNRNIVSGQSYRSANGHQKLAPSRYVATSLLESFSCKCSDIIGDL